MLDVLRTENFADLMLISTGLDASLYQDRLAGIRVVVRENVGYDFYSWRLGIMEALPGGYREAILLNSSFYVIDVQKFCALLRPRMPVGVKVRSLTVSWQAAFHAQSYFLQFDAEVLGSAVFARFWRDMQPISSRLAVIETYELGLSRQLAQEFPIDSIFTPGTYEKFLLLRRGLKDPSKIPAEQMEPAYEFYKQALNPSLMWWDCLLDRYGIVKKQLVHENPFGWQIDDIREFVTRFILD